MSTETIFSIILSSVTAATAVAAIIISVIQIKKSNKQTLFERRMKVYLVVKWMTSLCHENASIIDSYLKDAKKGPIYGIEPLFVYMTNSTFLEGVQPVINKPLDSELQRMYLLKMEELGNLVEEAGLVFKTSIGSEIADFMFYYHQLIVSIYKYKIVFDNIAKECDKHERPFPENDTFEKHCRDIFTNYLSGTLELLHRLDEKGVLERAKASIKL